MVNEERRLQYWERNRRITLALLAVWFVVTFVVGYWARDLGFSFLGTPFSFWVASQGAIGVYCAIIWYYAHVMNKLDREHGAIDPS